MAIGRLLARLALLLLLVPPAVPPAAATAAPAPDAPALYVTATGHHLSGVFADWWWHEDGRAWAGDPVTEPHDEDGRLVQYFEYARLELVPATAEQPATVALGHIGAEWLGRVTPGPASEDSEQDGALRAFAATGWSVTNGFEAAWSAAGGLARLGYPLSPELPEVGGRVVQYFERGRLEYRPGESEAAGLTRTPVGTYLAISRRLAYAPVAPAPDAVTVPPGPPDAATREAVERRLAAERRAAWRMAAPLAHEPVSERVGPGGVALRAWPALDAPVVERVPAGHFLRAVGAAWGEPVGGEPRWAAVDGLGFAPPGSLRPYRAMPPARHPAGRWLDANLDAMVLTAYEDDVPQFSVWINAGRAGWRTPRGLFRIHRRVRLETLDSATIGIPPGHPDYYYLPNVPYTLYFDGTGNAIHTTTGSDPAAFGAYTSFGCLTLLERDAALVWDFAEVGTPLLVRGGPVDPPPTPTPTPTRPAPATEEPAEPPTEPAPALPEPTPTPTEPPAPTVAPTATPTATPAATATPTPAPTKRAKR